MMRPFGGGALIVASLLLLHGHASASTSHGRAMSSKPSRVPSTGGPLHPGDNLGYPEKGAWGWEKPLPKGSLELPVPATWADRMKWKSMLNVVELAHLVLGVPAIWSSYIVFTNSRVWEKVLADAPFGLPKANPGSATTKARVFLFMLSPIIEFLGGGIPGIINHTYEGWQVAPCENPLYERVEVPQHNNQWLRAVVYKEIFVFQYLGFVCSALAVFGLGKVQCSLAILGFLVTYMGNQTPKVTKRWRRNSYFPVATYTLVPFVLGAFTQAVAFGSLVQKKGTWLAIASPILNVLGGVGEGFLAETFCKQWMHLAAVVLFNLGLWAQKHVLATISGT